MSDAASLLPPNATTSERSLARLSARTTSLSVGAKYRALWNPATCPASILPWLAWALHVDDWNTEWTEEQKRSVIAASVAVHKIKGTIGALKAAIASIDQAAIVNENTGTPFTFEVLVRSTQPGTFGVFSDDIYRTAMENKNARSKLVGLLSLLEADGLAYVGAVHLRGDVITINLPEETIT